MKKIKAFNGHLASVSTCPDHAPTPGVRIVYEGAVMDLTHEEALGLVLGVLDAVVEDCLLGSSTKADLDRARTAIEVLSKPSDEDFDNLLK